MFLELGKEREPCYIVVEVDQNCHLWVDMLNRKLGTAIAIPNELIDLDKILSSRMFKNANWFLSPEYDKGRNEFQKKKKKPLSFQAKFKENIKEPGLCGFKNKTHYQPLQAAKIH